MGSESSTKASLTYWDPSVFVAVPSVEASPDAVMGSGVYVPPTFRYS
jgi:hypothetical protein